MDSQGVKESLVCGRKIKTNKCQEGRGNSDYTDVASTRGLREREHPGQ